MKPGPWLFVTAATWVLPSAASAVEVGSEGEVTSVEIHAFASQGFMLSKDNNYIDNKSSHGSLQVSDLGINFTKALGDRLRFGAQLFAQNFGTTGSYQAKVDWFYLDYRLIDWLGIRAGRVKIPFGLYNEINDADSGRTFVLLPQSVYPIQNRSYLLAQTGFELYGYHRFGELGALDYRAYGGTIFFDTTTQPGSRFQIGSINVPFLVGGRLMWETPLEGLRVGGSLQTLRLDTSLITAAGVTAVEIPATLWVGSIEYAAHDLLLATEYSRWYVKTDTSNAAIFPQSPLQTSERAYGMVAYRFAKWLQPGAYYSIYFPNTEIRTGRASRQHDVAATLRFDINPYWLLKLEGHYMAGTAALSPALNDNVPLAQLERYWEVFFAKTTVYF